MYDIKLSELYIMNLLLVQLLWLSQLQKKTLLNCIFLKLERKQRNNL